MDEIIIVTGAEGFLGKRVVAKLAADGHSVIAVDRLKHKRGETAGVVYHQADLSNASTLLPGSVKKGQSFVLVHLAWDMRRHQGFAIQAEQVRQFAGILDEWSGKGLKKMVAMGSAEEYGGISGVITESDEPVLPLSPYGWAKRSAHDLAASWCEKSGSAAAWLRPFIVYGPGQNGDMIIPYAVECATAKKAAQFTDGQQQRDFVYVDDVADAIALAISAKLQGMNEINLGNGRPVKVADVLMAIAQLFNADSLFQLGARARRPGEPDIQTADIHQAKELLGWEPKVGWREGVEKVCRGKAGSE